MNDERVPRKMSRRDFLKLGIGTGGAMTLLTVAGLANAEKLAQVARQVFGMAETSPAAAPPTMATVVQDPVIRLAATDGHILLPGRDPLYSFGFVSVGVNDPVNSVIGAYKGKVQTPAPIISVAEGEDVYLTLTNLGFVYRPDLDDSHTIHWHGFRNPLSTFDGVPEVSIAVPVGRDFPYFYRPRDPGTYMYHCHFEDTEHVQMGMQGIVFVRPQQNNGSGSVPAGKYVYNDGNGMTAYDREFALLLNEIDTRPHDQLEAVQEFVWSDYKPQYWTINQRVYPDTVKSSTDPSLALDGLIRQPISSLIQANPGDRVLLRMANLGYEEHTMQLTGIAMKVVGHDATLLRGPDGTNLTYYAHNLYIGPGEARDAIFVAPAFDNSAIVGTDGQGDYNLYLFKNRNYHKTNSNDMPGLGGMVTEIRIYQNPLSAQSEPNQTFGV
ncbi:MAG: multicopper oxidase domain-containing protein [Candidatus Promineifilaceae bacterium]